MRALTKSQKSYIDLVIMRHEANNNPVYTVDDFDPDEWEHVEKLNDTEILWQEANRYISDKRIEMLYGGK